MEEILLRNLKNRNKVSISLLELQNIFSGEVSYQDFAMIIMLFEQNGILMPIKSHGNNGRAIPLFNSYKINKSYFKYELAFEIEKLSLMMHPAIKLDFYKNQNEDMLKSDRPFIEKMDIYLKKMGFPTETASSPERSYQIVGDEKWIDYKGGKKILERIGVWDKLKVSYNGEPLMLAVNSSKYIGCTHKHLIVENKATFYDCLEGLNKSPFTSLVFGSGWKIVGNIEMLSKQLGLEKDLHEIYYFGDLDHEGISIWYALKEKTDINLAIPYYRALLQKPSTAGKENQYKNKNAVLEFSKHFTDTENKKIVDFLEAGHYYPQEYLSKKEICELWSDENGF